MKFKNITKLENMNINNFENKKMNINSFCIKVNYNLQK